VSGQVEARWKFYKKWGMVAFVGGGTIDRSSREAGDSSDGDLIPSYGAGLRWMVLESKRINLRLDYARSDNNNSAWYLSVGEAF
jgi:outer membrane translocation and assembly module TamA